MSHANAILTERGRLLLARCVVDQGWPLRRAAERFQVSPTTAKRWADRYRVHGAAGMADRSSRPHRSPNRTATRVERRICRLRFTHRLGPARIAARLGLPASTVHRVLCRYRVPRLVDGDRATGTPVRRYERATPGELVHVDVKKLGNIPDGGGWRVHGRRRGKRHSQRHPTRRRTIHRHPAIGYHYLHSALDDHSRLAYTEILTDEKGPTAAAFWHRAVIWFAARGITVERILTDNGSCYRSTAWRHAMRNTDCIHKRTRPYRPQTNGKIERFHRTLLDEWAYARPYRTETERRTALPTWLHMYNHHRGHTALGGLPPASRVTNLSGQYS